MGCQASAHAEFKFRAGDRVEARFRGRAKRFPATIAKARNDGTYDVRYDDGVLENRVSEDFILESKETNLRFKRGHTQFNEALLRKPIHPFEVFKFCDRSGSGRICWEDFAAVCPLLGEPPSLDVFKAADTNHDGFVDYEEFEAMLRAGTCFGRPIRVDFILIKQGDHLKAAASKGASTKAADWNDAAGNKCFQANDFDGAIAHYTTAIGLDSKKSTHYSLRAAAFTSKGDPVKALADAEKCIELSPTWPKGYLRKGAALHAMGRYDDAYAAYQAGMKVAPGHRDAELAQGIRDACKARSEADSAANSLYEPAVEVGAKPTELATESELRAQLFGLAQSGADAAASNLYVLELELVPATRTTGVARGQPGGAAAGGKARGPPRTS